MVCAAECCQHIVADKQLIACSESNRHDRRYKHSKLISRVTLFTHSDMLTPHLIAANHHFKIKLMSNRKKYCSSCNKKDVITKRRLWAIEKIPWQARIYKTCKYWVPLCWFYYKFTHCRQISTIIGMLSLTVWLLWMSLSQTQIILRPLFHIVNYLNSSLYTTPIYLCYTRLIIVAITKITQNIIN